MLPEKILAYFQKCIQEIHKKQLDYSCQHICLSKDSDDLNLRCKLHNISNDLLIFILLFGKSSNIYDLFDPMVLYSFWLVLFQVKKGQYLDN